MCSQLTVRGVFLLQTLGAVEGVVCFLIATVLLRLFTQVLLGVVSAEVRPCSKSKVVHLENCRGRILCSTY